MQGEQFLNHDFERALKKDSHDTHPIRVEENELKTSRSLFDNVAYSKVKLCSIM